jgi:hypothetical protein
MNLNEALERFRSYDGVSQGHSDLLHIRQTISMNMYDIAGKIADLELKSKEATVDRKTKLAVAELESDESTVAERRADAVRKTGEQAMQEARLEGELKALKIKYDALGEVNNAISSFLKNG